MPLTDSEQQWLRVRRYLREHRYELAVAAARGYLGSATVEGTPLLTAPAWQAAEPVPLQGIDLRYVPRADFQGLTGTEDLTEDLRPVRADGSRYGSYSQAVSELDPPGIFHNRLTYRLLDADLARQRMVFSTGRYFDSLDVGEACAHEYAAAAAGETTAQPLRSAVGQPTDLQRRPVNVAVSTLTLRHDRGSGQTTFLLHRRDVAAVGHAGGLYQVVPVGIFQPAGDEPWNTGNDFSLWRCIIRELAEELLGQPETRTTEHPIDYQAWPFAARLAAGLSAGQLRTYCHGIGVDPLTLATDILTVAVFDAPLYDELFGQLVSANPEGAVLAALPFRHDLIDHYTHRGPTQAAGAALLRLAWRHRQHLLR